MILKSLRSSSPYLVLLLALVLSACTNREVLHGSKLDNPPRLEPFKRINRCPKVKTVDDSKKVDRSEKIDNSEEVQTAKSDKSNLDVHRPKSVQGFQDSQGSQSSQSYRNDLPKKPAEGKIRIWFARESKGNIQPYSVDRQMSKLELTEEPIRNSVLQLLRGPTAEEASLGVKSEIPIGTVLIGVNKKDHKVELNLSKRFASGGVDSMETRLQQLELTVNEAAGADKVYLNIDGKRLTTAGEGFEVKQPLN